MDRPPARNASTASLWTAAACSLRRLSARRTVGCSRAKGGPSLDPSSPPAAIHTGKSTIATANAPPPKPPLVGRGCDGRLADGVVGAGVFAEAAADALLGRNLQVPLRHARGKAEDRAVGAQPAAVRPPDEHSHDEKTPAENEHVHVAAEAKQRHEGIVAANEEGRVGRGQQDGGAEVNKRQQPEGVIEPERDFLRADGDKLLDGAQGADRGAKRPPEEEREGQRQGEDRHGRRRHGIGRIAQRQGDVLNGADGTDAAFSPESQPGQGNDGQQKKPPPRPPHDRQPACQPQRGRQGRHVEPLPPLGQRGGVLGLRDLVMAEAGHGDEVSRNRPGGQKNAASNERNRNRSDDPPHDLSSPVFATRGLSQFSSDENGTVPF